MAKVLFMALFITSEGDHERGHMSYNKGKLRPQLFLQKVVRLKPDQPDQSLHHCKNNALLTEWLKERGEGQTLLCCGSLTPMPQENLRMLQSY